MEHTPHTPETPDVETITADAWDAVANIIGKGASGSAQAIKVYRRLAAEFTNHADTVETIERNAGRITDEEK